MTNDVYINGAWQSGEGNAFINVCPSSGVVVYNGHAASARQVSLAVGRAKAAQPAWARLPQADRNTILRNYATALKSRKEQIAHAISQDMGKPIWESRAEANAMAGKVDISIKALEERAGERTTPAGFGTAHLVHRPHGVMAVLGPFNFPGHLPNGHIVPALLAGNCCVFKPSEQAPSVAIVMADAFEAAGLPQGCLSIVQGEAGTGKDLLEADINGVLFTGSVETGLLFHGMFAGRPEVMLALEMGGNNPLIVWEPCEVKAAANLIFQSAYITSGQRCSCARRLILPDTDFAEAILDELCRLIDTVKIGPWNNEDVFMGPLASIRAAQNALTFQDRLMDAGAIGIKPLKAHNLGPAYVTPGIIETGHLQGLADTELFGPLLQVQRVATLDEAVSVANATKFGLAGGLICDASETWEKLHPEMHAGILNWNRPTTGASSALPFGGPGHSGNFRPGAYYAADYCAWPQASQLAQTAVAAPVPGLMS